MCSVPAVGMGLGSVFSWQPSFAQPKVDQMAVGRYQVAVLGRDPNQEAIVVIDTATGQLWRKIGNPKENPWEELAVPPVRRSK